MVTFNLSGVAFFGITPFLNLTMNGLVGGILVRQALAAGITWQEIMRYTLPHSIELLAVWLSGTAGLKGACFGYRFLWCGSLPDRWDAHFIAWAAGASAVIIVVAAWLEAHVRLKPLLAQ